MASTQMASNVKATHQPICSGSPRSGDARPLARASAAWSTDAPHRPPGFTLIELAVVLVVMGIALAVAVPALPRPKSGADRAVGDVVRLLGQARGKATQSGSEVALVIDLETGRFTETTRRTAEADDSLMMEGAIADWSAARFRSDDGSAVMVARFDPLGGAEPAALAWDAGGGHEGEIRVDGWTGRVDVAHH
jgi:type II secretion system protein H